MAKLSNNEAIIFVQNNVEGDVVVCNEGVSFWGGVDPDTGVIIDIHHPNCGEQLSGKIVSNANFSRLMQWKWGIAAACAKWKCTSCTYI